MRICARFALDFPSICARLSGMLRFICASFLKVLRLIALDFWQVCARCDSKSLLIEAVGHRAFCARFTPDFSGLCARSTASREARFSNDHVRVTHLQQSDFRLFGHIPGHCVLVTGRETSISTYPDMPNQPLAAAGPFSRPRQNGLN